MTNATTGEQTIIWSNVTDLQPGSTTTLTFRATVDTTLLPVGSSFRNTGYVYGSTDPRQVPKFNADGTPVTSPTVLPATAAGTPTLVTPIKVTKSEPSPEGELLRGVHKQVTTYTLTVKNNRGFATEDTVLVDYVPATMEFLGCSGVDNTRIDPATGNPIEEYLGSGSLGVPAAPADCVFPDSVSTVTDPTVGGTTLTGVYTRLEWNKLGTLGDFAPNQVVTIRYAAGVPLRANTTNWSARPGGAPSAASGLQASNLDNNTGASTQETTSEQSATNVARIEGTYRGPFAEGSRNPVFDQTTATVTLEDVSLQKSVDTPTFAATQIATFTLKVRVSEYVNSKGIRLTDLLPNGYCPLSSTTNYVTGAPLDCAPIDNSDPTGATFASVTQLTSGEFRIVFSDLAVDANGIATVTFKARMRESYTGGSLAGTPTTSGDSFTNRVTLTANTTPIPGTNEPPAQVLDQSEATQTTEGLTLNKRVQPRRIGQDCDDSQGSNPYVDSDQIAAPGFNRSTVAFRKGDRVCFQLDVTFPRTTASRNVVITDIIPEGTAYEALSQDVDGIDPAGVTFNEAAAVAGSAFPTWQLRSSPGSNSVLAGTIVRIRFSVLVTEAAPPGSVDITGNLMKMSTQSSSGQVRSYRDEVPFGIIPAPPVPVVKGIAAINGAAINVPPAPIDPPTTGVDGRQVVEGDVVRFRVDITNGGNATDLNAFSIRGLQVWDVLPAGIRCAQISNIGPVSAAPGAPIGVCTDPPDSGHPTFTQRAQLSAIVWTFRTGLAGDDDLIPSGATRTLTYDMTIPTPSSINGRYDNTAHVRSFDAFSNRFDTVAEYYPSDNVDTTVDAADYSGPPSRDASHVVLPNAAFSKVLIATGLDEQNNPTPPAPAGNVAVNGESATYRIRLDIPARTSVFNGRVTEPLPDTLIRGTSSLTFYPDAASPTTTDPPPGVTFDAPSGLLTLNAGGSTYTNATNTTQRFEILVEARVSPTAAPEDIVNRAAFRRTPTTVDANPITRTAQETLNVLVPDPSITKDNNAGGEVRAGSTVEYTLRATNLVDAPPLHDTVVYDCVPAGLRFLSYGTPTQGSTVTDIPGDGIRCPTTSRQLQWNVGTVLGGTTTPAPPAPDPGESLTYTVEVDPAAAGGATYTNTVAMTGSTLPNGVNDPAVERIIGRSTSDEVRVAVGALIKTVNPDRATIGQRVEYSVAVTIPQNVNFYDAVVLDTLPAGIDASSVTPVSVQCVVLGLPVETCTIPLGAPSSVALPGGETRLGWYAGDIVASARIRVVTYRYTAVVADNPGPSPVRGGTLTNSATTGWFLTDDPNRPTPGAGSTFDRYGSGDTATVTVLEPQIALAKSVSDSRPEPGDEFTYSVRITNGSSDPAANNSTAFDLVVVDAVPNGVVVIPPVTDGSFVPDSDPADGGGTITWAIDSLAIGATVTRSYAARLADSPFLSGSALTNTVRATEYRSLDGAGRTYTCPNCATATASVTPDLPALEVTKTAVGGAPAYIDEPYPWRITVTNTGDATTYDVVVSDSLPPNWRYEPGTSVITRPGGSPVPEAPSNADVVGDVQSLTWGAPGDPVGDLLPGESLTIDFAATPQTQVTSNPTVGSAVPHLNEAEAVAVDGAGFPGYDTPQIPYADTDDAQTRIDSADLAITKSHSPPPQPAAGASFDWRIDVRNDGTDTAVGAFTVSDDLPTGVIPNGVPSGEGWTCTTPDAQGFTCQRTDSTEVLASGASFPRIVVPVTTDPSTAGRHPLHQHREGRGAHVRPGPGQQRVHRPGGIAHRGRRQGRQDPHRRPNRGRRGRDLHPGRGQRRTLHRPRHDYGHRHPATGLHPEDRGGWHGLGLPRPDCQPGRADLHVRGQWW